MSAITEKLQMMKAFKARTPATNEQVQTAEIYLGLSFAREYKEYLLEFGCASIYGHEFTGICKAARLDVVSVTTEQKNCFGDIPNDWYVIEETNIDGIVIWQNAKGDVFSKAPNAKPEKIAKSFSDYVEL